MYYLFKFLYYCNKLAKFFGNLFFIISSYRSIEGNIYYLKGYYLKDEFVFVFSYNDLACARAITRKEHVPSFREKTPILASLLSIFSLISSGLIYREHVSLHISLLKGHSSMK